MRDFINERPQTCKNGSKNSSESNRRSDPRGSVIVHLEAGNVAAELRARHVTPADHVPPVEHPKSGWNQIGTNLRPEFGFHHTYRLEPKTKSPFAILACPNL